MKKLCFAIFFFLTLLPSNVPADTHLKSFVSIIPQSYFVERIAGEYVSINVLVAPGQSPHSFEPTPKQVADIVTADIYFITGLPFEERLLVKIRGIAPDLKIIDTAQSIKRVEFKTTHRHADDHDPHVWLDPKLAKAQAENIAAALTYISPEHSKTFMQNLNGLKSDLDELDSAISAMLKPFRGRKISVSYTHLTLPTKRIV